MPAWRLSSGARRLRVALLLVATGANVLAAPGGSGGFGEEEGSVRETGLEEEGSVEETGFVEEVPSEKRPKDDAGAAGIGAAGAGKAVKEAQAKTAAPPDPGALAEPAGRSAVSGPEGPGAFEGRPTSGEAAVSGAAGRRHARRAMSRANSVAGALRSSLAGPQDALPAGAGAGAPGSASASPPGVDLAALASSGYAPAIQAMGYRFGSGPDGRASVLKLDGSPASGPELDALRERLEGLPRALMKRPDFFKVVGPENYERVKALRAKSGSSPAFRDVGLSAGRRDLLWTRSCGKVSGDCNPAAAEPFYRIGDFVSPETLNNISDWLDGAVDEADRPAARPRTAPSRPGARVALVERLLEGLRGRPAGGSGEAAPVAAGPGPQAALSDEPGARAGLRSVEPEAPQAPAKETGRRSWLRALLACAGLAMLAGGAWRARCRARPQ